MRSASDRLPLRSTLFTSAVTSGEPYTGSVTSGRLVAGPLRGMSALLLLRAVTAASLLAVADALSVQRTADDLVADAGEIPDAPAPDQHDRVLLQVVADAGDVGRHLDVAGEPDPGDLTERRVRLLGRCAHGAAARSHRGRGIGSLVLSPRQAGLRGDLALAAGARAGAVADARCQAGRQRCDVGIAFGGSAVARDRNARQRPGAAYPGFLRLVADRRRAAAAADVPARSRCRALLRSASAPGQAAASRSSRLSRNTPSSASAVASHVNGRRGKAASAAARLRPTSTTSTPSGFRNCAEWAMMVRTASRPSSPPASAICGSCAYSGGSSSIAIAVTYGGLLMISGYVFSIRFDSRSDRIRLILSCSPCSATLRCATASASEEMSEASMSAFGK